MVLAIPVLVLSMDEARDRPVPPRGVDRVQPLSAIAIRVRVQYSPGDLLARVQPVRVLRKRILRTQSSVTFVIWIECVPFPSVLTL